MSWKIIERISDKYPGSIVRVLSGGQRDEDTRFTYFWDEKYNGWSVIQEEHNKSSDLWFVINIDKAQDEWYLESHVPVAIATWVSRYQQQQESRNEDQDAE